MPIPVLQGVKIRDKIAGGYALITFGLFALAGATVLSLGFLERTFTDYRAESRDGLFAANLVQAAAEVRMGGLKYRISRSEAPADRVNAHVAAFLDEAEAGAARMTSERRREAIGALSAMVEEYGTAFDMAVDLQARRDASVELMDTIGPDLRRTLSEIAQSAFDDRDAEAAFLTAQVVERLMLGRLHGAKFLLRGREVDADLALGELARADEAMDEMERSLDNVRRRQMAASARTDLVRYREAFEDARQAVVARDGIYQDTLDRIGPVLFNGLAAEFAEIETLQNTLGRSAERTMSGARLTAVIVGAAVSLIAIAIAVVFVRFLAAQVRCVVDQMNRLASGDKDFEVIGAERGDEFGDMARALDVFRANAQEVARLEDEQKAIEARAKADRETAMAALADEFEERVGSVVKTVNAAAREMSEISVTLSEALGQTNERSATVASASEQASANVQTVAAAAEELATSVREISERVTTTAEAAKACAGAAGEARATLSDLRSVVEEIDGVIVAINEVAEQTNLLALNATIESARAGEAGRGFAVVANEVKALAGQTHQMTGDIADKVRRVKDCAEATITGVEDIVKRIDAVNDQSANVAAAVDQQDSSTTEISRNAQEAAKGTDEVNLSIAGVREVVSQNSETTKRLNASAKLLDSEAANLNGAVEDFLARVRAG